LPDGTAHTKTSEQPSFQDWTGVESHLAKNNNFDNKIKSELPDTWLPFIKDDTPIILDLSDIAKPYAKRWIILQQFVTAVQRKLVILLSSILSASLFVLGQPVPCSGHL